MKTLTRNDLSAHVNVSGGVAEINRFFPHLSAEVRELNPELKAAYEKFEAQNAKAITFGAEERALIKRRVELRRSRNAVDEYDQDLDNELTREIARIERERKINGSKAKKLAIDYLELVEANRRNATTQERSAALALEAHEEAVEAFAKLEAALQRRDMFYNAAGAPAVWKHHSQTSRIDHNNGEFARAHHVIAKEVSDFPADETRTVADGGTVPTLEERQAMSRAAYEHAIAQGKAEGRRRDKAREIAAHNS